MTWRVHSDPKPGAWTYCVDPHCLRDHYAYVPFHGVRP